jgi:outer membrane receptor protein involved in Fe transport
MTGLHLYALGALLYLADPAPSGPSSPMPSRSPSTAAPATAPDQGAPSPTGQAAPPGDAPAGATTDDVFNLDIDKLGNVPVQPSSSGPSAATLGSGIDVSGTETTLNIDSSNLPAPTSTGDLLRNAPSVQLRRTSAINLDPRVRGYHSQQISASAAGVPQLKTRVDIDSLFSQVDPALVTRLSVVDGPYSSIWGPGFAFLTADLYAANSYDTPQIHERSYFGQDSNGGNLAWQQSIWGGGPGWGVYSSYVQRAGNDYQPGHNAFDFDVPASYNQSSQFSAFTLNVGQMGRLEFHHLRAGQNNVELPGVLYDIRNQVNDQYNFRFVIDDPESGVERFVAQYWNTRTTYDGNSFSESKRNTLTRRFAIANLLPAYPPQFRFLATNSATVVNGGQQTDGFRLLSRLGYPDSWLSTFGIDGRQVTQRHEEYSINSVGGPLLVNQFPIPVLIPGFNEGDPDFRGIPRSRIQSLGLFTHHDVTLTERDVATIGSRVDFVNSFVDSGDIVAQSGPFQRSVNTNTPSRVLGMGYATLKHRWTEHTETTAGVGFGMRNASIDELYSDLPSSPSIRFLGPMLGNGSLEPEKNLQFDLGQNWRWENLTFGIRGFHSTVWDYILPTPLLAFGPLDPSFTLDRRVDLISGSTIIPDSAFVVYQYANIARATLYGGDVSASCRVTKRLWVDGNLAYVKGTNHAPLVGGLLPNGQAVVAPSTKSSEGLPNIFPLTATVALRWIEPEEQRWGLGVIMRMASDQNYIADGLGEVRTPGFFTVALQGHYDFNEHVRFRAAVTNLFDRAYTEHGSLAITNPANGVSFVKEPGISFFTGLEVEF